MAPGEDLRKLGIVAALVFLVATSVGAGGIVLWDWHSVALGPRDAAKRAEDWSLWCYEVGSERRLNCQYTLKLRYDPQDPSGLLWNGGHMHPGRESSELAMGRLTCNGVLAKPPACEGYTYSKDSQVVSVWHEIPQVSGTLTFQATQTFPSGYTCVEPWMCDDETNTTWLLTLYSRYGIDGLVELPSNPDNYVRCGLTDGCTTDDNEDPNHPMAFFGTPAMVNAVGLLARKYRQIHPGLKLRLTDMSLAGGGLFDIHHDWNTPHEGKGHRVGTGLDVSQGAIADAGGLTTVDQIELDRLASLFGLTRYEAERPKIHYNLKPPKVKGGS